MAVKLVDSQHIQGGIILGTVAADSKADITDHLKFGDNEMGLGSIAYTNTTFDWATCDSNGHWTWQ